MSNGRLISYPPPKMKAPQIARVHIVQNIVKMTEEILKDTNTKMRHIEKYVDMYRGKTSFEMGAAAGEIYARFKNMIKIYKEATKIHTDNSWWNWKETWNWRGHFLDHKLVEYMINKFQICQGEYNEILYLRGVFYATIEEAHERRRKKLEELNRNRIKNFGGRRRFKSGPEQDSLESNDETHMETHFKSENPAEKGDPKDLYVDYWGHLVDRNEEQRKMEARSHDRFEKAYKKDFDRKIASMFIRNDTLSQDELVNETSALFARVARRREQIARIKEENERIRQERAVTRVNDDDFKRSLRQLSFQRRRANFSPEREGIDINLADMV
ncbi:uncharacterized protein LOC126379678 [Pectinophora gossypiella]|uniref:uncharacterized protein LOC126379678 n=1 Tax=Pectinophora gossypiella TaxID=13191 RepID=UPI00214E3F45|nr:uncharacterized protein LOC126379678 [Pectinophora gossypiella]